MVIGIILNFVLSLWIIPQYVGAKRKIGFWWSLVACVFLTPFVGGIITSLSPKLEEYKTENIKKVKERKRVRTEQDKKLDNLKSLKDDGILTETEYQDKVETLEKEKADLEDKRILDELKKQDSYIKLKSLFDSGVLAKEEFDMKVKTLKERQKYKTPLKSIIEINKEILRGKWESDYRYLYFLNDNEVVIITKDNSSKPMKGNFKISEGEIVNYFFEKKTIFKVIEITKDNLHFYENKNKRYFKKCFDFNGVLDFDLAEKEYKKFKRGYYLKILALLLILILTYFIFKK